MKKYLIVPALIVSLLVCESRAEPLLFKRAGCFMPAGAFEIGIDRMSYSYDKTEFEGTTLEWESSKFIIPFSARYAFNSAVETEIRGEFITLQRKSTRNGTSNTNNLSGNANPTVSGKYSFPLNPAVMSLTLEAGIPSGDEDFGEGFDIYPSFQYRTYIADITAHFSAGYKLKGTFDNKNDVEVNPGDIITLGAGAQYPMGHFDVLGEFLFESLGEIEKDDSPISGSSGTRITAAGGIRYDYGSFRTNLGLALALGDETYREYDYKVFCGIKYRI